MTMLEIEELGLRLARIDRHLIEVLALRIGKGSLSEAVAESKRQKVGAVFPIKRPEIEEQRLALVEHWAKKLGLDPNYAASVLNGIIAESCRIQAMYMYEHIHDKKRVDETDETAVWKFYRRELLRLTKAVASSYDENYATDFFGSEVYVEFEREKIAKAISDLSDNDLAIDLGCATGRQAISLASHFQRVVGYDISPAMLTQARAKKKTAGCQNVVFKKADLEIGIPEEDNSVSFVVMSLGTTSDIRNMAGLMSEIKRVLKSDGRFVLSFYNANSLLSKFDFLPWPVPLAAMIDNKRHCLEVHFKQELFFIYAQPRSVQEIESILFENQLLVDTTLTHPTVSSVLPTDILSTEIFGFYNGGIKDTRRIEGMPKVSENVEAKSSLINLDEILASSPLNLGAYLLVIGHK